MELEQFIATDDFNIKKTATFYDYDEAKAQDKLKDLAKDLRDLQRAFYANGQHSLLICIQGMDTSGKDSMIRHVFGRMNPQGVRVTSFKKPTSLELAHDYLWRHQLALPSRGMIGIFNRTHYENLLVTRVHPEYLLYEKLPDITQPKGADKAFWRQRMQHINAWEQHLVDSGTLVLKFFLNFSKDVQAERLIARLETPEKYWKFDPNDMKERGYWGDYMHAYEDAIQHTSTRHAPWYVIPADSKPIARMIVGRIVREALLQLDLSPPAMDKDTLLRRDEFLADLKSV